MRSVLHLVTQLEPAGAQVVISTLCSVPRQEQGPRHERKAIFYRARLDDWGPVDCLFGERPRLLSAFKLLSRIRGAIRPYDVVFAHTHYAAPLARIAAIGTNVQVVAVHHGPPGEFPLLARMLDACLPQVLRYFAEIGVSPDVATQVRARRLTERQRSRVSTVPNPLPTRFGSTLHAVSTPAESGVFPVLLSVGRLVPQKNHQFLLRVVHHLIAGGLEVRCRIAGEGPLRASLERLAAQLGIAHAVTILGRLSSEEIRDELAKCSVFFSGSVWEAMPISVIEACAVGKPIVASDIVSHRYTLEKAGAYFPLGNIGIAAAETTAFLRDSERSREFSLRALDNTKRFDPQACLVGYNRVGSGAT